MPREEFGEVPNPFPGFPPSYLSEHIDGDEDILRLLRCLILFALAPDPVPCQNLFIIPINQLPFWNDDSFAASHRNEGLPTLCELEGDIPANRPQVMASHRDQMP